MDYSFTLSEYTYQCDCINKTADRPIAEQDKVRQESQTENARKKEGGVCGVTRRHSGSQTCPWRAGKATSHVVIHKLIEMGLFKL